MESNFIDWHPADIIAGLRKKGNVNGGGISPRNGLSSSTLANALSRPMAERRDDYCESPGN